MATHGKDDWRLCAEWLVRCQILVEGHKVTFDNAQVFDLAQVLRDGVLICHLLNRLYPTAIDAKDFSQRPQMSQFLCLKNIRVFLQACKNVFGLEERDLFEPYDLFEVKDFGKVIKTLAKLSKCSLAQKSQILGFQTKVRRDEDDIYGPLIDIAVACPPPEDKDYDLPTDDEEENAEKIYEDLTGLLSTLKGSQPSSKRDYCVREILETEKNYTEALKMICEHFIQPLKSIIHAKDHETIFFGIESLEKTHTGFLDDLNRAQSGRSSYTGSSNRMTIPDCFVQWKEQFLIYGEFCSNLPRAQELLDETCTKNQVINQQVQDFQMKANQGKFRLRDLLSVPMQRVLKYHLLLKELIKNTADDHPERDHLQRALDEMQDLSLYVNEVKRDSEQLQFIQEIANSIVDLQMPQGIQLKDYGRIQLDGELKVKNHEEAGRNKTRYVFVFDKVMLLCKSRGDSYNFRDALVLSQYKVEKADNTPKNHVKAERGWQFPFFLVKKASPADTAVIGAWTIFCKTEEMRRKWMENIEMAQDNTSPPGTREGDKDFIMHSFEKPTICDVCKKLLRGVFYQGYKCQKTGTSVHKGCIVKAKNCKGPPALPSRPKVGGMKDPSITQVPVTPRKPVYCKATHCYSGNPRPTDRLILTFDKDDTIELLDDKDEYWWEGRLNGKRGYFPSAYVAKSKPSSPQHSRAPRASYEQAAPHIKSPNNNNKPPPAFSFPAVVPPNDSPLKTTTGGASDYYVDLSGYPWYVGQMARDTAIKKLESHKSGVYLIRERVGAGPVGDYALSIKYVKNVKHIKVQKSADNHFFIADTNMFRTIPDLVSHYQRNTLGVSFPELPTTLQTPYKDAERQLNSGSSADGPEAIGKCASIYSFAANQSNQLSLDVGDVIEIISKAGGDRGWWKGRKGSKVGYFPSAYVEEDEG